MFRYSLQVKYELHNHIGFETGQAYEYIINSDT